MQLHCAPCSISMYMWVHNFPVISKNGFGCCCCCDCRRNSRFQYKTRFLASFSNKSANDLICAQVHLHSWCCAHCHFPQVSSILGTIHIRSTYIRIRNYVTKNRCKWETIAYRQSVQCAHLAMGKHSTNNTQTITTTNKCKHMRIRLSFILGRPHIHGIIFTRFGLLHPLNISIYVCILSHWVMHKYFCLLFGNTQQKRSTQPHALCASFTECFHRTFCLQIKRQLVHELLLFLVLLTKARYWNQVNT